MMDGCNSCFSDRTVFISFHLWTAYVSFAAKRRKRERHTVIVRVQQWWKSLTYVRA